MNVFFSEVAFEVEAPLRIEDGVTGVVVSAKQLCKSRTVTFESKTTEELQPP